jgi:hypothetical protein
MNVQDSIEQYKLLSPKIFHQGIERYLGANIVKSIFGKSWFKGKALEDAVKDIIKSSLSEDERGQAGESAAEMLLVPDAPMPQEASQLTKTCKTYYTCSLVNAKSSC